ncbi:related to THG1 - protein required for tRNA-His guanylylation at 5 prime end [Ustilago sp. UG-2017b]|nr:related to THG1 - protein required for tRNA-His guanylylation at 5 prime end [Ustilago sp. UG-2017b]
MTGTRFAYVRNFELPDPCIPSTYLIVRIDGKGFHKFSALHSFLKPNDPVALELMNESARHVMRSLKGHISLAFGESDEYSFLLRKSTTLYNRRISKITTHMVSLFTSAYVWNWARYFPGKRLEQPPSFDGRLVVYPSEGVVRDYFSWRQADTHINSLYNTTFWALVLKGGRTEQEATKGLERTVSADKHEILYQRFGINYDKLEPMFRKGTTLIYTPAPTTTSQQGIEGEGEEEEKGEKGVLSNPKDEKTRLRIELKKGAREAKSQEKKEKKAKASVLRTLHCDLIGDDFWNPAPISALAMEEETISTAEGEGGIGEPWNNPARFNGAGMGVSVFLA